MMRSARARRPVLAFLWAVVSLAGFLSVVAAHAGLRFCSRRLGVAGGSGPHHHGDDGIGFFFGMGPAPDTLAVCPLVLFAAVVSAALVGWSIVAYLGSADRSGSLRDLARVLVALPPGRLWAAIAAAAALPTALSDAFGIGTLVQVAIVVASALAVSAVIVGVARVALDAASRILATLLVAFRRRRIQTASRTLPATPAFAVLLVYLTRAHGLRAPPISA